MAYGALEDWLAEEAALGCAAAIKAFEIRPVIQPHLQFVWSAFRELESDRPLTMGGVAPIPFSSIDRYATRFGVDDPEHFSRFLQLIRRLDLAYLKAIKGKS